MSKKKKKNSKKPNDDKALSKAKKDKEKENKSVNVNSGNEALFKSKLDDNKPAEKKDEIQKSPENTKNDKKTLPDGKNEYVKDAKSAVKDEALTVKDDQSVNNIKNLPSETPQPPSEDSKKSDEKEEKDDVFVENNLELYSKNPFVRFARQVKQSRKRMAKHMESMSKKEKLSYLYDYYKWPVIITLIIIVVGLYTYSIIARNSRPSSISYVIINNVTLDDSLNRSAFDRYCEYYGLTKGYKKVEVTSLSLSIENYKENPEYLSTSGEYTSFTELSAANYFDIFITDRSGLDFLSATAGIRAPSEILNAENMELVKDHLVTSPDKEGKDWVCAIDVSDLDEIKSLNLRYSEVFLCFCGNSEENILNSNRFTAYIFK